MLSPTQFDRLYRYSTLYDLIITAPFATPWSFVFFMGLFSSAATSMGLPGILPTLDVFHIFFANLMGSVVVIWGVVRWRLRLPILLRYDAAARFLFSTWMVVALLNGANLILLAMLFVEITLAVLQSLPVRDQVISTTS